MSDEQKQSIWDKTPEYRYRADVNFKQLVDLMESFIHQASYTPSELREASLLAAIHYESRTLRMLHREVRKFAPSEAWDKIEAAHELLEAIKKERP